MRVSVMALAGCIASFAVAQSVGSGPSQSGGEDLPITKRQVVQPAPPINTYSFFPQIARPQIARGLRPENPKHPLIEENPAGGLDFSYLPVGNSNGNWSIRRNSRFPGITNTGWVPPDPHIAVGPNHIVQVVNSSIAFFDKATGNKQFEQTLSAGGFWSGVSGVGSFVFDPKVIYDPDSQRFIVLSLDVDFTNSVSGYEIAISDDSNPNGTWFRYYFDNTVTSGSDKFWGDYPSMGVNEDYVAVSCNMFAFSAGSPPSASSMQVFKKTPMLTGQPLEATTFSPNNFTIQLAKKTKAGDYPIFGVARSGGGAVTLYAIREVSLAPVVTTQVVLHPGSVTGPGQVNARNTFIDTVPGRIMDACAMETAVVWANTIGNGSNSRVRWGHIEAGNWPAAGTPTLIQTGNIQYPDGSALMPAIAINEFRSIAVVFTRCSPSLTPRLAVAARRNTDPLGVMSTPTDLASSANFEGSGGGSRWGDYAGAQVDPSDPDVFWVCAELFASSNLAWTTEITSLTVNSFNGVFSPFSVTPLSGTNTGGNVASFVAEGDNNFYDMLSASITRDSQQTAYELLTVSTIPWAEHDNIYVTIVAQTPEAQVTGYLSIWNYAKQAWEILRTSRLGSTPTVVEGAVGGGTSARNYVHQTSGNILVRFSTLRPHRARGGSQPVPYTVRTDKASIEVNRPQF